MQNPAYLFDENNETGGALVPAQIFYDAFHGRFQNSTGAVVFLCIIWGSFFFCGLSVTTSAARVVRKSISSSLSFSKKEHAWRKMILSFLYRFMHYQETTGFHFRLFGEDFTQSTRFQEMQCGCVQ